MRGTVTCLIFIGVGLSGCQTSTPPSAKEYSESINGDDMSVWYILPPVKRITHSDTLIPILKIDGTYYTVCRGFEIPLKECPEGLQWGLTPSSMSETTIGFHGPSDVCTIRIVDRLRAGLDDFYLPDEMPPIRMTRTDKPSGLLDATAQRPRTIDDFLGLYQPVWFPGIRWEIRKEKQRYVAVDQELTSPQSGAWKIHGEPYELALLSDRRGFTTNPSEKDPVNLTYNDALKRFELIKTKSGIRMPLARVSPSSGSANVMPPIPIGIPAWH